MSLVDEHGDMIERYEYTLYGQRTVFRQSNFFEQVMHVDFDGDGDLDALWAGSGLAENQKIIFQIYKHYTDHK